MYDLNTVRSWAHMTCAAKSGMCSNSLNRCGDSTITIMPNPYEKAREAGIARNKRVLAEHGLCERAAEFVTSLSEIPKPRKSRASKVKGCEPSRRSDRNPKLAHSNLSEDLLLGGPEPKRYTFTASRRRFERETMPKRKAPEHEFSESYSFTDDKSIASARLWYAILARQPGMKEHLETCEQIAFNLGEQWVYPESIRGANDDMIKRFNKEAFTDMTPKLGPEACVENVLEQLRQGARTGSNHMSHSGSNTFYKALNVDLTNAGAIAGDESAERRHGPGQSLANNTFRDEFATMVATYGDAALRGMEHFVAAPDREAVMAPEIRQNICT